jgi:hypothetical protein
MFCTIFTLFSSAMLAQQQAGQNPPLAAKLFAGSSDVTAMIAKAKSERKPDQANFIQPIVRLAPYNANLEYRVAGVNAPASVHEREAEMFYVVEGSGTRDRRHAARGEADKRGEPERLSNRRRHAAPPCQRRLGNGARKDGALVHADRRHTGTDVNPPAARGGNNVVTLSRRQTFREDVRPEARDRVELSKPAPS